MAFLSKLNIKLPYDLAITLLDIYTEKLKTEIQINIRTQMFIAAPFTIAKRWKQPKYSSAHEQNVVLP